MSITAPSPARLDRFLRFEADVDVAYEQETGAHRVSELRRSIVVGLFVYNIYNLTSIFLLPDILELSVVLRIAGVTPVSLVLMWLVGRVDAVLREWLVTIGVINAFALPVFLFYWSDAGLSAFTFGELPLTLVFGNMLLMLRFRRAIVFTMAAVVLAAAAAVAKAGLPADLKTAFLIQIATGVLQPLRQLAWRSEPVLFLLARTRCKERCTHRQPIQQDFRGSLPDRCTDRSSQSSLARQRPCDPVQAGPFDHGHDGRY